MTDETAPPPTEDDEAPSGGRSRLWWGIGAAVAVAALTVLLVVGLANRGVSTAIDDAIERGDRAEAPDFTLPLLIPNAPLSGAEGRPVTLSDLRGRPVIVNMWASWCVPCRDEAPLLDSLVARYGPQGVVLLGVNVQDISSDARDFARVYDMRFPSVRDGNDDVKNRWGATGVPETFIVDRDGRVALALRGPLVAGGPSENFTAFRRVLEQVVAEPAGGTATGTVTG